MRFREKIEDFGYALGIGITAGGITGAILELINQGSKITPYAFTAVSSATAILAFRYLQRGRK